MSSVSVTAMGRHWWSSWVRLDHPHVMLGLCCQIYEKWQKLHLLLAAQHLCLLVPGKDIPNFLSGTVPTPILSYVRIESKLTLNSKKGPLVSKAIPWPQWSVQEGHMTQSGQSSVRKHLLGPSEKEAFMLFWECCLVRFSLFLLPWPRTSFRSHWQPPSNPGDHQP